MIDEWGAVETSDWGENLVHAKIDKNFDPKKTVEKTEEKSDKTEKFFAARMIQYCNSLHVYLQYYFNAFTRSNNLL